MRSLGARLALAVLLAVLGALLLAPLRAAVSPGSAPTALAFDAAERARIGELGPWPPAVPRDASNRVSGHRSAIAFGEVLFHSARLSSVGGLRCASCHEPWRSFTDARALGLGAAQGGRNTMSLLNVGLQDLFGPTERQHLTSGFSSRILIRVALQDASSETREPVALGIQRAIRD